MRIMSFLVGLCFLTAFSTMLIGQTAVEYGTIAAGSTAGSTADAKDISKSIGGVFGRLGKQLDTLSTRPKGHQTAKASPAAKRAASSRNNRPAASSAARPEASPIVSPSQIRIGMSREKVLNAVGDPSMQISGTDDGIFTETYLYGHGADTVTVTLRGGKVTAVSKMPEKSVTTPALATQTAVPQ